DEALGKADKLDAKTSRERDYLVAMAAFYGGSEKRDYQSRADAYTKAMQQMYEKYPDDREAAAFYALSLLASEPDSDTTFTHRKQAAAVLEKLFQVEPDHPGVAHYLIHSYDSPQMAQLGLPAARRYAKLAPAAPHALHMPSHIFARLGLWQDDIDSNLASIAATRKTVAMHMGGEGHQFHAMHYLVYAYLQSGRESEAKHVLDDIKGMPPMKDMYGMGFDPRAAALSELSGIYALELHHWSEAASLPLVPGASAVDNDAVYWARAIGAAKGGNIAEAQKDLKAIQAIRKKLLSEKKKDFAEVAQDDYREASAWLAHAQGKDDQAVREMRALAEKQESVAAEPMSVPAREMLADMLLEMKRPEQALAEYQADLKNNPNRFNGLYGAARASEMTGNTAKANDYYSQLLKVCAGSESDRPELAHAKQLLAEK
ncbi:MAG TPA: hypothetical protein VFI95_21110, partial [Terriglobales bacterium]|nr:hypothetical protein [Terriglobales bacterium]